ncbi:MAG: hydrogenase maturation nickel metallochaperone HypA [Endomicrobia bacterium]|nr:hydrogenase maturation nickel metallochaperone HypA [Endomicrobiia bacterium]
MHEHGIAKDMWKVIADEAEKNGIKKITKVTIVLGEASGIEQSFLTHSFADHIFAENEIASGAELEYEIMPLAAKCNVCLKDIKPSDMDNLVCPHCKSNDIKIVSGREAYVKSIETE